VGRSRCCFLNDQVDGQIDAAVELAAQFDDVEHGIDFVEVGLEDGGGFLKERVVVVPGHEVSHLDAAILGQDDIDLGLGLEERLARQGVELIEELDEVGAVLLIEEELQGVVVGEAELWCGFVAQLDKLGQVLLDSLPTSLLAS